MKTLEVTNLKQMAEVLGLDVNSICSTTDLDDIDDSMSIELAEVGLVGAITPELPQREFNIRTLTQEKLDELRR